MGSKIKIVITSIWNIAKVILFIKKKDEKLKTMENLENEFGDEFNETMEEIDKVSKKKNKTN